MKKKPPPSFEDLLVATKSYIFDTTPNVCWRMANAIIESEGVDRRIAAAAIAKSMRVGTEEILEKLAAYPAREHDIKRSTGPHPTVEN